MRLSDAARQLESSLVNGRTIHPCVDEAADDCGPQTAGRVKCLEFGNASLQKFAMQRILGGFSQALLSGRVDTDRCLKRGRAIDCQEHSFGPYLACLAPGIERTLNASRHAYLYRK